MFNAMQIIACAFLKYSAQSNHIDYNLKGIHTLIRQIRRHSCSGDALILCMKCTKLFHALEVVAVFAKVSLYLISLLMEEETSKTKDRMI